ncbi:hypothetical protein [Dactylosporangium sp. CA-233914]|uniref:hypothetical protein n=1 Tax=Dactylosporangium sp. CA-233914 TaxID=3239934 RepID=UPI003D8CCC59
MLPSASRSGVYSGQAGIEVNQPFGGCESALQKASVVFGAMDERRIDDTRNAIGVLTLLFQSPQDSETRSGYLQQMIGDEDAVADIGRAFTGMTNLAALILLDHTRRTGEPAEDVLRRIATDLASG